jgi:hypothetical protein
MPGNSEGKEASIVTVEMGQEIKGKAEPLVGTPLILPTQEAEIRRTAI